LAIILEPDSDADLGAQLAASEAAREKAEAERATMREALAALRDHARGLAGRMKKTPPTEGNWNVAVFEVIELWGRARAALDGKQ
jgi:hypothetical protein